MVKWQSSQPSWDRNWIWLGTLSASQHPLVPIDWDILASKKTWLFLLPIILYSQFLVASLCLKWYRGTFVWPIPLLLTLPNDPRLKRPKNSTLTPVGTQIVCLLLKWKEPVSILTRQFAFLNLLWFSSDRVERRFLGNIYVLLKTCEKLTFVPG